jgi:hypothetical protein
MAVKERPRPALAWPDQIDNELQRARDIVEAITNGTTGIVITALQTSIDNAQIAQTAVSSRFPGTAKTRNKKFGIMKDECEKVMDKVYEATEGLEYTDAVALINANGFPIKGSRGIVNKQVFEVRHADVLGELDLIAKASEESRQAHEWYYSLDEGLTWIYINTTLNAKTSIKGLPKGKDVDFRHRIILKDGPTDWHYDEITAL